MCHPCVERKFRDKSRPFYGIEAGRHVEAKGKTMTTRFVTSLAAVLGLAVVFIAGSPVRTQEPAPPPEQAQAEPAQQEGVTVQARGPVHEAFAEPTLRAPRATPVVPKQPPQDIDEIPPDQKPEGDNVPWIP